MMSEAPPLSAPRSGWTAITLWSTSPMCVSMLQDIPGITNSNRMTLDKLSQRLARVVTMLLRGQECFDTKYYLKANPHYRRETSSELWADFVRRGQFRGDKFRYESRELGYM